MLALALALFGAGACSPTPSRVEPLPRPMGFGPAPGTAMLEREIRYYKDEKGAVWDDRGRKQEATLAPPAAPDSRP